MSSISRKREHPAPGILPCTSQLGPFIRGNAFRTTPDLVIKRCSAIRTSVEVEALAFVAAHTTIPVPRVHCYWIDGDEGSVVMDYMEGEMLQRVWRRISDAQRLTVMRKIATFVDQLRAIPQPRPADGVNLPPTGWIGSPLGHGFCDFLVTQSDILLGPFPSERAFWDWRVSLYKRFGDIHPPTALQLAELRRSMPCDHPIVFTHGDINRRNILVRVSGDGPNDIEITAVLDWEQAGWRPIHWESVKWEFIDGHTPVWGKFGIAEIGKQYQSDIDLDLKLQSISGYVPL
ncbi:kinase-like protein [Trametes coccinea BRFM310]|uniref:Kinase-like protein n=1 Tax=Trametes coccinea (strain BRFM310) TaxID=1353009 RepID=A0A1Y2IGY3_TRAC3|nr:kinase-like protein [Trametes coccinea BRFM310]